MKRIFLLFQKISVRHFLKNISFENLITRLRKDRLFAIRFMATILCLDFLSFTTLSSINLIQFLNPFHFMTPPPIDKRASFKMFYPPTLSPSNKNQKEEKQGLIQINQRIYQENFLKRKTNISQDELTKNFEILIHELTIGINDIRVKRAIKTKTLIRKLWVHQNKLIVHLNDRLWSELDVEEKEIIKSSIFLSITANFKNIKNILWTL